MQGHLRHHYELKINKCPLGLWSFFLMLVDELTKPLLAC